MKVYFRTWHFPRTRPSDKVKPELQSILSRLHILVVGPGLGGKKPTCRPTHRYPLQWLKKTGNVYRARRRRAVHDRLGHLCHKGLPSCCSYSQRGWVQTFEWDGHRPKISHQWTCSFGIQVPGWSNCVTEDIVSSDTTEGQMEGTDKGFENVQETVEVNVEGGLQRCGARRYP